MKVLLLGCGEMGEAALEDLYFYGKFKEITVGTRSVEKVSRVLSKLSGKKVKVIVEKIDVEKDQAKLVSLMKKNDVAINCIGPNYKHEERIAKASIQARVHLVDINDDYETTFKMLALDEEAKAARVTIILGLGSSPGINNIFVRAAVDQLDEIEEIHTAWVMSGADPGGLALSYHLLNSLSGRALTYQDGQLISIHTPGLCSARKIANIVETLFLRK